MDEPFLHFQTGDHFDGLLVKLTRAGWVKQGQGLPRAKAGNPLGLEITRTGAAAFRQLGDFDATLGHLPAPEAALLIELARWLKDSRDVGLENPEPD